MNIYKLVAMVYSPEGPKASSEVTHFSKEDNSQYYFNMCDFLCKKSMHSKDFYGYKCLVNGELEYFVSKYYPLWPNPPDRQVARSK